MDKPIPQVNTTDPPANRFTTTIYFRVSEDGVLIPLKKKFRKVAHYRFCLEIEYPTYEEELQMKQNSARFDDNYHYHFVDTDAMTEARIRRCLRKWDLHTKLPELTKKLQRSTSLLTEESLDLWRKLPPLVRKSIAQEVNNAIGGI